MAHFAELDEQNIVTRVIVVGNDRLIDHQGAELEELGIAFCKSLYGSDTRWAQTSYNANFRKNYAGIGCFYDPVRDAFIAPQPYPSWTLDENTCRWQPPVPYPDDGDFYVWDELNQEWTLDF